MPTKKLMSRPPKTKFRRKLKKRMPMKSTITRPIKAKSLNSYLRPNKFAKLLFENENNNISIPANGYAYVLYYPMNPAPLTNSIGGTPQAGDVLYTGMEQYGNFFNFGRCLGAKIKCTAISNTAQTGIKFAIVPVCWRSAGYIASGQAPSVIYSSYSQQQLFSYPGTKFTSIGAGTGGSNVRTIEMYRSSARMLGSKSSIAGDPYTVFQMNQQVSHILWSYPNSVWYYLVIFYNENGATPYTLQLSTRITGYFEFWGEQIIDQQTLS